jgi:superfamily II DNA/RNA helicase
MNPIELAQHIEKRYLSYLKTTFYFKDPELRKSFEEELDSGRLSKGPYLEATPVFKRSETPQALFPSLLGSRPDEGFLKAVQGDRPLYQHQKEAIERTFNGSNVVVATGTGSGKTESFLYPILLHLYQEFQAGKLCPGVRALILYPMNALANDQRDRLGEICRRLQEENSPFQFTYGQYIGETPENEIDSWRHARDHIAKRLSGELVLRSEMRKTPPHILLTNYSMLEYLLLRPDDSPLFDNGRAQWWTFLILDEAHQYRGSRGIEMAMLLRRLKQRLGEGGRSGSFRCIATSATLAGGEGDNVAVATFATDLFDEEFHEKNIILGETEAILESSQQSLLPDDYHLLKMALNGNVKEAESRIAELALKLGVQRPSNEDLPATISTLLQHDHRATALRRAITGNPIEVRKIADQTFSDLPDKKRVSALADLVELLIQTRDLTSDSPLLSARYHVFFRSLEGAYVSYWPQKKVYLDRKTEIDKRSVFEVALCRECGQHYFVGHKNIKSGKLMEAIHDPSDLNFGATFFRPIDNDGEDEEDENNNKSNKQVFDLCVECGEVGHGKPKCGHEKSIRVMKEDSPENEDRADQMKKCGSCEYNAAGRDPVREVVHGADGPHAVIATTLHQQLPKERNKVLAFADGRQEAAFFAWYLEDSYKDIMYRNLILKAVQKLNPHAPEGSSLRELATNLCNVFREKNIYPPARGDLELRREAWLRLYREFLTDELRIALEGVGLIRWSIKWPPWFKVPDVLMSPPFSLSMKDVHNLIYILLDSMKTDRAVELATEDSVSLNWSDLCLQGWQTRVLMNEKGKLRKGEKRWGGKTGKRVRFLTKLLMKNGLSKSEAVAHAVTALRAIWETIQQCDENAPSSHDRLLLSVEDARRLNPDWWRLHLISSNEVIYQCDTCSRLQAISVRAVCPRHRCPGTLEVRQQDLEPNHYRLLYEEGLMGPLRVEEHTAQLDKEKAREFQREFKEGKINVLSCSTTFELGVDLGDLDTIFLRNVPPEAFNYAQRVGRSGRRIGHPGFAITYCRRGPHDLYHFSEPLRMLTGKVRSPTLSLRNEKIIVRHVVAMALSAFFRVPGFSEKFKNVESLFKGLETPSGVADFKDFLNKYKGKLERALNAIVPAYMLGAVGLNDGQWIERIAGKIMRKIGDIIVEEESRLSLAEAEVSSDFKTLMAVEKESRDRREYKNAEWAQKRANTIADEPVLSFLSRKSIIPKYGFPVDVVELDTQGIRQNRESFEVSLQRDLSIAISEFAPTSKLVANKKVWTSYGLKRVAEKEWDRWWYARCTTDNHFERKPYRKGEQAPSFDKCCPRMTITSYIDPKFGFVTNLDKPEEPKSRPTKLFSTRPYFASFKDDREGGKFSFNEVTLTRVSPGYMVVLCEGRHGKGFYICGECGAGFRKWKQPHETSHGQECRGELAVVSLGHEFVTDVFKIQFHANSEDVIEPVWLAHSVAYALVEGAAEILEVPSTDLNATVMHIEQHAVPPIILYDNVPGGAGLVARLEDKKVFQDCLEIAKNRVSGNCGCAENTSCYGCLRSFKNQFAHQYLNRGAVKRYLEKIITQWNQ